MYKSAVFTRNRDRQRSALATYAGSHSVRDTMSVLECSKCKAKKGLTLSRVGLTLGIRKTSSTSRRRLTRSKVDFLQAFALRNIEPRAFSRTQKFEVLWTLNRNRLHAKYCRDGEAVGIKSAGKTVFWAYLSSRCFKDAKSSTWCCGMCIDHGDCAFDALRDMVNLSVADLSARTQLRTVVSTHSRFYGTHSRFYGTPSPQAS